MDNLWLKVENIVVKGEIARFEQFFCHFVFKKPSAAEASIWGKVLNVVRFSDFKSCLNFFERLFIDKWMILDESVYIYKYVKIRPSIFTKVSLLSSFYHVYPWYWLLIFFLALSHLQTNFVASAANDFWNQSGKRRNCSQWTISPFVALLSNHVHK